MLQCRTCSRKRTGVINTEQWQLPCKKHRLHTRQWLLQGALAGQDTGNNKQAGNFRMQLQAVQAVNFRMQPQAVQAGNFRMQSQTVHAVNFSKQAITGTHTCGIFNIFNRRHVWFLGVVCRVAKCKRDGMCPALLVPGNFVPPNAGDTTNPLRLGCQLGMCTACRTPHHPVLILQLGAP